MQYVKKTLFRHSLAVAIGFGLLCANSLAQVATPVAESASAEAASTESVSEARVSVLEGNIQNYKVDIDLAGKRTRITEFVRLIQKQLPSELNIVVTRDANSLMVPPMRLRKVSVQAALNAVAEATENEMNWHFGDDKEVVIVERDLGYGSDSSDMIEVVNASAILKNTEEASLLSAIEIGLELRGSTQDNVTIKLHKETKLLFVKGIVADIKVVKQILSELGDVDPKRAKAESRSIQIGR